MHNMIAILAKNTLNSIETLIFQVLINSNITYEEYTTIIAKSNKYRN